MSGWTKHNGMAIALDRENVDTDQLIPARFMSTPRSAGYGQYLLHDLRFDADGEPVDGISLNDHPGASVLITRRNFGSGSSREAAVYALADFGIKAVLAPSFGDIFRANAINNGVLPAVVDETEIEKLIAELEGDSAAIEVSLDTRSITVAGRTIPFILDETWRQKLINGWDDIDLTLNSITAIRAFSLAREQTQPWLFPSGQCVET